MFFLYIAVFIYINYLSEVTSQNCFNFVFLLQFSDNYYRAELIDALTNSLTPAISINNEVRTVDNLNTDVRLILEEITRFLNMEKLLPSYCNTITVRCVISFT